MALLNVFKTAFAYNPQVPADEERLVKGASFAVYARGDVSRSTPLVVREPASGALISPLRSNQDGALPDFTVDGNLPEVVIMSGSFSTVLQSSVAPLVEAGWDRDLVVDGIAAAGAAETARAAAVVAQQAAEDSAAQLSTSRTLRSTMRPYDAAVYAGATITHVADASALVGASPVAVLWNDLASVTYPVGVPVEAVPGSTYDGAAMRGSGSNAPQSLYASYVITGDRVVFMANFWATCDITVYVDRKPVTAHPYLVPAGQWFVVVAGLGAGVHTVELVLGWAASLIQVIVPQGGSIGPGPASAFRVWVTGDSYAHSGVPPFFAGLVRELHRLTGWAIGQGGQGSTGYTNDGHSSGDTSKSVFGSPARLQALEDFDPDLVIVLGSVNDGSTAPGTVYAAAGALYAAVARPQIVIGVEPLYADGDPTYAQWDIVNAAITAAASLSDHVFGVIDWRTEDWLTGSGSVSAPAGNGNQDYFIGDEAGTDTIHPNYVGQRYLAGRMVERIAALPWRS